MRGYQTASRRRLRGALSSVWLPWAISASLLLALAGAALIMGSRETPGARVSPTVLSGQQTMTTASAQVIRRNLNAGLQDLTGLAGRLSRQGMAEGKQLRPLLNGLRQKHGGYRALYVTDRHGKVVARVGPGRHRLALPARLTRPGLAHAVDPTGRQVIAGFAPLAGPRGSRWILAGEYDVRQLQASLQHDAAASAWVVDEQGRALHPPTGSTTLTAQDHAILERAAAEASQGAGYEVERNEVLPDVVSWAPVEGAGPAGSLGLGVVSSRPVEELTAPPPPAE